MKAKLTSLPCTGLRPALRRFSSGPPLLPAEGSLVSGPAFPKDKLEGIPA